jgi:hypothetical protein
MLNVAEHVFEVQPAAGLSVRDLLASSPFLSPPPGSAKESVFVRPEVSYATIAYRTLLLLAIEWSTGTMHRHFQYRRFRSFPLE